MLVDEFLRQMGIQKIPTDPRAMRAAMRVAGLMSGTSGDGIDVAIVDIVDDCTRPLLTLVAFDTVPYAQSDRDFLFHLFSEQASVRDLCQGNFRFGRLFGEALLRVCESSGIPLGSIELIGSHGQTVWHEIDSETGACTSTLQVGESAVIAEVTGRDVVSDFRVADVAAGGQGAPLTSTLDALLYTPLPFLSGVAGGVRALQNIGGMGNVTFLAPSCPPSAPCSALGSELLDTLETLDTRWCPTVAFDTGPGNALIDWCASKASHGREKYDKDGSLAFAGTVSKALLEEMMQDPFFARSPPKTTGRELFSSRFAETFWDKGRSSGLSHADLAATFSLLTVSSIVDAYARFCPGPLAEVVISGGGSHNPFLMSHIQSMLNHRMGRVIPVRRQQDVHVDGIHGIDADAKEGVLFAVLAWWHVLGRPGNMPTATGAAGRRVLGKFTPACRP